MKKYIIIYLFCLNQDLREREQENQALMDRLKQEAATFREESRVHILKCNNKVSCFWYFYFSD